MLGLLDWLVSAKGLTREEAYMLISVAENLKLIHERPVRYPIHTVSASIHLGILPTKFESYHPIHLHVARFNELNQI